MRDLAGWSFSLGRWWGVQVRLHAFFLLFALLAVVQRTEGAAWYWPATLGTLFVSVLLHELGHVLAARRLEGQVDQIVLWPLGGLTAARGLRSPRNEVLVAAAGPAASGVVCAALAGYLLLVAPGDLRLSPLHAPWIEPFSLHAVLATAFWVNWLLLLVNLLPAGPLDGGKLVRAGLATQVDAELVPRLAARLTLATALALLVIAGLLFLRDEGSRLAAASVALLGIVLALCARQEADARQARLADDFPWPLEYAETVSGGDRGPQPSLLRRWLDRRRQRQRERRLEQELSEERQVDEILARLHQFGRDSLSQRDLAILERASARYRARARS